MSNSYLHGFTKIFCKEIKLHKNIEDSNLRLIFGEYKKLYIIDANDIPETAFNNTYMNLYNIPKTEYIDPLIRFYYYYGDYIVYPYLNCISIEDMKREPIKVVSKNNYFIKEGTNNYTKSSLYAKIERDLKNTYYITYYINNKIIDNIKNNKKDPKLSLLTSILISQKGIDIANKSKNMLNDILNNTPNVQDNNVQNVQDNNVQNNNGKVQLELELQGNILKPDVTLFDYQTGDINWMNAIENSVLANENNIEYNYSLAYNVYDKFIAYNNTLFPIDINIDSFTVTKTLKYYGGNIISEVGLGKTLITLYYILSKNKNDCQFVEFTDGCNYFYKRGKSKGENCKSNSVSGELYCKSHKRTMFIDKRNINLRNLEKFSINDYMFDNKYITTNATLILCPNHLCDQWVQEYYSKFKNNHRVLLIVTYDQYTNVTLADLLFADIVIISYNFLVNKRYVQQMGEEISLDCKFKNQGFDINKDLTISEREKLLNSKAFSKFSWFHWDRIIYDESHEIQNIYNNNFIRYIKNINSTYKWNISGTPFANKLSSFINLMSYNTCYNNSCSLYNSCVRTDDLIELGLDSDIINKCKFLFRRNTKQSIKNECTGNILKEQVNLLDFTCQERSIYDGYVQGARSNYYDFLIKLCCHPELNNDTKEMIKNCKTFDEIHKCMVDHNKNLLERESMRIKNAESDIKYYESEINKFDEPYSDSDLEFIEPLRLKLNGSRRQLTLSRKSHQEISRTYNYLRTSVETLKNTQEEITCPICLDEIETDSLTITKCGHKFCWDCIYATHQVQKQTNVTKVKCPTCNTLMDNTEIYLLSKQNLLSNESDLQTIIQNVKSTKIGNIIYFLKTFTSKDDKIILFSQWDELLHKVGGILSDQGLKIMYCNGTVYQRKRAIDSFCKDPDINLILLSSRNAASGINLTVANKIILLEPIYGNKDYRENIEEQAIGRADRLGQKRPIYIYRFIIKNTIEEDIYTNCIDDSKIRQLN